MNLTVKIVLIVVIIGIVATGIAFGVLCMMKKDNSGYKYPRKVTMKMPSDHQDEIETFKPLLVSGAPHLGPLEGETQQPNCGVIYDNIDVDYGFKVDPMLGPVSPECQRD